MKNYIVLLLVLASASAYAQINIKKVTEEVKKTENAIVTPTTTTPTTTPTTTQKTTTTTTTTPTTTPSTTTTKTTTVNKVTEEIKKTENAIVTPTTTTPTTTTPTTTTTTKTSTVNKVTEEIKKTEKTILAPTTTTPTTTTTTTTTPKTTTTTTTTSTTTTPTTSNSNAVVTALSDTDVADGLKEALVQGSSKASKSLNVVDGFYKNPKVKIPFPEEAQKVADELRKLGYGSKVDDFEKTLNRSAEQAAIEAAPIFKKAITGMTFKDAKKILTGSDTAATHYLRDQTYSSLYSSFTPHISKALGDNNVTSKWTEIIGIYNKIPLVKKVNPDLVSFTTNKALKGLFILVAEEEGKIRKNPVNQTTDLLKKVFGGLKL